MRKFIASLFSALALTVAVDPGPANAQLVPTGDYPDSEEFEVETHAAYRFRSQRIEPLELNGTAAPRLHSTEQRLRLDSRLFVPGVGGVTIQLDALDGVLVGDNGRFGGNPSSNSGVSLAAKRPNLTRWTVGLPEGGDPLDPDDYVPVLEEVDPIELNWAYADIVLPVGLLRVGRQPIRTNAGITAHDGQRRNRWGVSKFSDTADRILFGTKLDQAYYMMTREDHVLDASLDNGLIWGVFYDFLKQDDPVLLDDDLRQAGSAFEWRRDNFEFLGFNWSDFLLAGNFVYLWNDEFNSDIMGFPVNLQTDVENVTLRAQYMHINGRTREIAEGFSALSSKDAERQRIIAHGAQFIADVAFDPMVFTLEVDYATGDGDPRTETPITSFSFARDLNVGLLMFEHLLAFESARSVAVGVENLSNLDVESFPLTEVQTDGRFTNAIAVFPQFYLDVVRNENHRLHTRLGVLMAWAEADLGVVDPIMTILAEDGDEIIDDAVNYNGGKPGVFYGTEIDAQIGWRFKEHFVWTVEGAYMIPGSGFEDENGDAVNAYLLENRFELLF